MADADEQFARILAYSDNPSLFSVFNQQKSAGSQSVEASKEPVEAVWYTTSLSMATGTQHFQVDASDPEYNKIKADLESAGLTLTKLVRLNNASLIEKFQYESAHLKKVKKKDFELNITNLYHGTMAPFDQICDEGLDERLSRRGRFGRGIYFSDNPKKCCDYTGEHRNSRPYLLRCRVILGDVKEYPAGEQDKELTREPLKTVKDGKRVYYDSVKGHPRHYNEFVIYDKRRALIDYIAFYDSPSLSAARASRTQTNMALPTASGDQAMSLSSLDEFQNYNSDPVSSCSRSSTPVSRDGSMGSGQSSPASGRCSPVEFESPDAVPVHSDFYNASSSVPRVKVSRNRTVKPTATDSVPQQSDTVAGATASASSAVSAANSQPAASALPDVTDIRNAPQMLALKSLLDLKGKLPPAHLEKLTQEYHRTYGVGASSTSSNSSRVPEMTVEDDPVSEVMSKLVQEFKDVTQCTDVDLCRQYIELGNMDLNQAVAAYIDATS